jgi:hypothetical protein
VRFENESVTIAFAIELPKLKLPIALTNLGSKSNEIMA